MDDFFNEELGMGASSAMPAGLSRSEVGELKRAVDLAARRRGLVRKRREFWADGQVPKSQQHGKGVEHGDLSSEAPA